MSKTAQGNLLDYRKIRLHSERTAITYDQAAILQREVGQQLLERLDWIKLTPKRILDLGCGTGFISEALLKRYPKAEIIGVDIALSRVLQTRKKRHWLRKPVGVVARAEALPFADQAFDMVISNLMLHWCNDLLPVFKECARVLRPEGLLTFTTLGTDTLKELRTSYSTVYKYPTVHEFKDMHDMGDALLATSFRDPVVDRDDKVVLYKQVQGLLNDLKQTGSSNVLTLSQQGLIGKSTLARVTQAYEAFQTKEGHFPATFEVIFGHAWAPQLMPSQLPERYIPIKAIK